MQEHEVPRPDQDTSEIVMKVIELLIDTISVLIDDVAKALRIDISTMNGNVKLISRCYSVHKLLKGYATMNPEEYAHCIPVIMKILGGDYKEKLRIIEYANEIGRRYIAIRATLA